MIDRLLNLHDLVDDIFSKRDFTGITSSQERKMRSLAFTYDDWELLNALHDCLEPFDKVTTILSGDYPTQSMAYFAVQTIRENVQEKHHPSSYHAIYWQEFRLSIAILSWWFSSRYSKTWNESEKYFSTFFSRCFFWKSHAGTSDMNWLFVKYLFNQQVVLQLKYKKIACCQKKIHTWRKSSAQIWQKIYISIFCL